MTVKELIEKLKEYPENLPVVVFDYDESIGLIKTFEVKQKIDHYHLHEISVGARYLILGHVTCEQCQEKYSVTCWGKKLCVWCWQQLYYKKYGKSK